MTSPVLREDPLFFQRLLKISGFYTGALDGKWGPNSTYAAEQWDEAFDKIKAQYGAADLRSESNIATLLPQAQVMARQILAVGDKTPFTVRIISGTRTYAEQNALYAQGRSRPGHVVTNARGGQSNHNFAIAVDVGIFVGGLYYTGRDRKEEEAYDQLAVAVKAQVPNVDWGGDWHSIKDKPHYEVRSRHSLAEKRAMLESGKAFV